MSVEISIFRLNDPMRKIAKLLRKKLENFVPKRN